MDKFDEDIKKGGMGEHTVWNLLTDTEQNPNIRIVYELSTSGNIGCFEKTKAHIIAYYIPGNHQVHMISVKRLREYVSNAPLNKIHMGDNATGYLLPIEDLKKNKVIIKTFEGVM